MLLSSVGVAGLLLGAIVVNMLRYAILLFVFYASTQVAMVASRTPRVRVSGRI